MSLYSHSAHSKFSMPWSHWPTSSPVMVSSAPQPRQVTSCQSLQVALASASRRLRRLKCRRISVIVISFFIVFLSLTGISLTEKAGKVNQKSHFISFFLFLFLRFSLTKKGAKLLMISKNRSPKSLTIKDLRLRGGGPAALSHWGLVVYDFIF